MEDFKAKLARMLLGKGAAGQAADINQLYPIYQRQAAEAQMQGMEFPNFDEWHKQYMTTQQAQSPTTIKNLVQPQY